MQWSWRRWRPPSESAAYSAAWPPRPQAPAATAGPRQPLRSYPTRRPPPRLPNASGAPHSATRTAGSGGSEGSAGARANAPARAMATKATLARLHPLPLEAETETRCPPQSRTSGVSALLDDRPFFGRSPAPAPFLRPATRPLTPRHAPYIVGVAHSHLRTEQITLLYGSGGLTEIYLGSEGYQIQSYN